MQLVETKEQLEHRVSDLKLLFELESAMGQAATMEELATAVITEAGRACGARAGGLLVDEAEGGVFLYYVEVEPSDGAKAPEVKRVPMKRGEGIIGWAMAHNEAVGVPADSEGLPDSAVMTGDGRLTSAEAFSQRITQALGVVMKTAIAVPLEGEDDAPIGAVALYNSRSEGGFSKDDRALLRLVSANASTAVRLFRSRVEREQSERLMSIGRLLSGVMHDMRTPLTVISGYVQLMTSAPDAATRDEHARLILKQFDVISAMQREVLEFARGERSILVRRVYLTKFFGDMEKQLAHELEGTNVTLAMELDDRGTARFDEAKMTRVMHNLVRNAAEAMRGSGGKVTVRAFREGSDLVVSVADTGKGIPKEIEGRLFQSFVTSGKRGGTGLGLAIVKKIVDEHGGMIEVESSSKGAKFTIRLPQESAATRSSSPSIPPPPPSTRSLAAGPPGERGKRPSSSGSGA
jgi:signal transduction histidine kinase